MRTSFLFRTRWLQLSICTLIALCGLNVTQVWADSSYTLGWGDATGTNYTNFTTTSGTVDDIVSFSTAKNSAGNAPARGTNPNTLRLYYASNGSGGSVTLTPASGVTITSFTITTTTNPTTKYKIGSGALTTLSLSGSSSNYTGSVTSLSVTSSITIQNCNTSNTQLRIKLIEITYTTSGSSCGAPTSPTNGSFFRLFPKLHGKVDKVGKLDKLLSRKGTIF